ncbi:MAG: RDD family protein [Acidobacteria bacterium]|nr:RDD family protein [Acidobacteriota bacterium]
MKCPKCQYVGFDAIDRCRHCGFEFALTTPVSTPADLPLQTPDGDLPLLGDDDLPLVTAPVPPPRPAGQPLSVRRSSSDPQRARRYPRPVESGPAPAPLPLDPEPEARLAVSDGYATAGTVADDAGREASRDQIGTPATVAPRIVAALIDFCFWLVVIGAIVWATLRVTDLPLAVEGLRLLAPVPLVGAGVLAAMVYQVIGLVGCGQTLGKMVMRVTVQMQGGGGVGIDTAVARAALTIAAVASLGLVYVPFLMLPGRRTLHDRLTHTEVVVR